MSLTLHPAAEPETGHNPNPDGTPSTQLSVLRSALKRRAAAEADVVAATAALQRLLPGPIDVLVPAGDSYDPCVFRIYSNGDGTGLTVRLETSVTPWALDKLAKDARADALHRDLDGQGEEF